jgi:hypothetical protein
LALLRDEGEATKSGDSPIDTSRGWPVFTSPIAKQAADAFDHRALREDRIDELVARALNEDRI